MTARTHEQERADVLTFLEAETEKMAAESQSAAAKGDYDAAARLGHKASILRTMTGYIRRGDHVNCAIWWGMSHG